MRPSARRIPPAATTTTESRTAEASASAGAHCLEGAPERAAAKLQRSRPVDFGDAARVERDGETRSAKQRVSPPNCTSSSTRAGARHGEVDAAHRELELGFVRRHRRHPTIRWRRVAVAVAVVVVGIIVGVGRRHRRFATSARMRTAGTTAFGGGL